MYKPFTNETIDMITGRYAPNTIKLNSRAFDFWVRAFFQRAQASIKLNVVDEWQDDALDVLYYWLFRFGFVGVFELARYGLIFQRGCAYGHDIYYRPTRFRFSNPNVSFDDMPNLYIGENCGLLKLTPDYMGIWDIIIYYAEKMAGLDNAVNMSIVNNKLADILFARNKASAEALKKVMDKVNKGEPTVIVDQILLNDKTDKDSPFQRFERGNLKNSYITDLQLRDMATIISMFDNEIGIPSVGFEKKERMIEDEANGKVNDSTSRARIWVNTLNRSFKQINDLFDTDMSAELTFKGGVNDVNNDDNIDRDRENA